MQDATYRDRTAVTLPDALPRLPLTPAGIQEEIAFVHELQDACGYDLPHSRYPQPGTEVIDRLLRPEESNVFVRVCSTLAVLSNASKPPLDAHKCRG